MKLTNPFEVAGLAMLHAANDLHILSNRIRQIQIITGLVDEAPQAVGLRQHLDALAEANATTTRAVWWLEIAKQGLGWTESPEA